MNKLENMLENLPVKPVPASLDRRVEETFAEYESSHSHGILRRSRLLTYAAAALVVIVCGLWQLVREKQPPIANAAQVVCVIEANPEFISLFAPEPEQKDFFLRRKEQIN